MSFDPVGPAAVRKRVLVVGGGPAGLEAARTAALRGHEVHLHEATRQLGGQVAIAATAPHRSDIGAITEWLAGEVERLGVTIRLSSMVEPDVRRRGGARRGDRRHRQLAPARRVPAVDAGHARARPRPAARVQLVGRVRLRRAGPPGGSGGRVRRHRHLRGHLGGRRPARGGPEGDDGRPVPGHRRAPAVPAGHGGRRPRAAHGRATSTSSAGTTCWRSRPRTSSSACRSRSAGGWCRRARSCSCPTTTRTASWPSTWRRAATTPVPVHLIGDVTGTNGIRPAIHQAAAVARAI